MTWLSIFFIALVVSYLGSIPPGGINITTLQYALSGKKKAALTFGFAAAFIEFFYAGIAVKFQIYLTENADINNWFKIVTGSVLILLGLLNVIQKTKNEKDAQPVKGEKRGAFMKGVVLALTNPLAIPYWLVVTSYLSTVGWITLNDTNFLIYIAGVSCGTYLLLITVTYLGTRFDSIRHNAFLIYRVPGMIFIAMGLWTFVKN